MRYILPVDATEKLSSLRTDYQKEKGVDLDVKHSMIGRPKFFGGVDYDSRNTQTVFIKRILTVLRCNLKKMEEITTPEELLANSAASRLCLVACWYIQSQNSGNSVLSKIIDKDLGITKENFPDPEDKDECYATAKRLLNAKNALEDANKELMDAGVKPLFTETEWNDFKTFVKGKTTKPVPTDHHTNYPVTSITKPLFGAVLSNAGMAAGLLSGDMISQSANAMSAKYQLSALIGGSLLVFGTGGHGVALLAPIVASKLINAFCSITLAHVMGAVMGLLGQGIGTAVGIPLDLAYHLLWKTCALISGYCTSAPENTLGSGLRIFDNKIIMSGVAIEITPVGKLPEGTINKKIEIKEDGSMLVDGKAVVMPKEGVQLPAHVVEELIAHLKEYKGGITNEEETDTSDALSGEENSEDSVSMVNS